MCIIKISLLALRERKLMLVFMILFAVVFNTDDRSIALEQGITKTFCRGTRNLASWLKRMCPQSKSCGHLILIPSLCNLPMVTAAGTEGEHSVFIAAQFAALVLCRNSTAKRALYCLILNRAEKRQVKYTHFPIPQNRSKLTLL